MGSRYTASSTTYAAPRPSNWLLRPDSLAGENQMLKKSCDPGVTRQTSILSETSHLKSQPLHFSLGLGITAPTRRTHHPGCWDPVDTFFLLQQPFRLNQNIESSRFSSPTAAGVLFLSFSKGGGGEGNEVWIRKREACLSAGLGGLLPHFGVFLRSWEPTRTLKSSGWITPLPGFWEHTLVTK